MKCCCLLAFIPVGFQVKIRPCLPWLPERHRLFRGRTSVMVLRILPYNAMFATLQFHRRRGMLLWSFFFVLIDNNTPKILLYIQYLYCKQN